MILNIRATGVQGREVSEPRWGVGVCQEALRKNVGQNWVVENENNF